MAILELKLHDIDSYIDGKTIKKGTYSIMSNNASMGEVNYYDDGASVDGQKKESTSKIYLKSKGTAIMEYIFFISNISFQKKMYQPTEIIALIDVYPTGKGNKDSKLDIIDATYLKETFGNHRVSLLSLDNIGTAEDKKKKIGEDYYIHDVLPHYKKDYMNIMLKIYSLDKQLTITNTSQSFVAKKLGEDILKGQLESGFPLPYNKSKHIEYTVDKMHVLKYEYEKEKKTEHIFPYLVQYNETFYDLLCRTANRWGEFLYYEDGKLHVGYDTKATGQSAEGWTEMDYIEIDDKQTAETTGTYAADAAYDTNILESPLTKSPEEIKNLLGCSTKNGLDIWFMKTIAKFLGNEKNLPTLLGNLAFDEVYDQCVAKINKDYVNTKFDSKYFSGNTPKEQYGHESSPTNFNQFSELNSIFKKSKYLDILKKEFNASKRAIKLNYDTTYPNFKLGDIISVYGDDYIVTEINCSTLTNLWVNEKKEVLVKDESPVLQFNVIATGRDDDKYFYPTVLPSGHTRKSGPQLATVTDAEDPLGKGRVRVMFDSWQEVKKDAITDTIKATSSPWLIYAATASSQGNGLMGRHYEGDQVVVNFAHGNVERPYIVGGLLTKGNKGANSTLEHDIVLSSPGGHVMRINDGLGAGLTAFLGGVISPGYGQLSTFLPTLGSTDFLDGADYVKERGKCFDGGFTLSDRFGVYTISGSTSGRNVSIKSPWGDVKINAFTGISIEAPNGNVSIKGKNVRIEAGNNLELVSGTNASYTNFKHGDTAAGTLGYNAAEIALAVAKKLAAKIQIIDLTFVRSVAEVVFRPVEGALTVKSNRFLKLEAGKSACDYPTSAYKDKANQKKVEKDTKKIREGLKMQASIVELITKVGVLANEVNRRYKETYNRCVTLYCGGIESYDTYLRQHNSLAQGYPNDHGIQICKTFQELEDVMWAAPPYKKLKEESLGFKGCFKTDDVNTVDDDLLAVFDAVKPLERDLPPAAKKQAILKERKRVRKRILEKANALRKAICTFLEQRELSADDIGSEIGWFWTSKVPDNYKAAMVKAFDKEALGDDCFYYKLTNEQKALTNQYTDESLENHKKALKRKAAIVLLEGLGFKDEWRKAISVRHDVQVVAFDGPGIPPAPQVPPVPPEVRRVPKRCFKEADITDQERWEDYVNSICSMPKLNAAQFAATKVLLDGIKGLIDWKTIADWHDTELSSWSDAKNGGILFTHKGNTYSLQNNISKIEGAGKEKLVSVDDPNDDVNNFLNALKENLKHLN